MGNIPEIRAEVLMDSARLYQRSCFQINQELYRYPQENQPVNTQLSDIQPPATKIKMPNKRWTSNHPSQTQAHIPQQNNCEITFEDCTRIFGTAFRVCL